VRRTRREFIGQRRQRIAQRLRQVVVDAPPAAVLRLGLGPTPQRMLLVRGVGAEGAQAVAEVEKAHGLTVSIAARLGSRAQVLLGLAAAGTGKVIVERSRATSSLRRIQTSFRRNRRQSRR
jgi:hypothetical protein